MMKNPIHKIILVFLSCAFLSFPANAQTGGTFDLSHNVIASGGGSNSTGGSFTIDGTTGQTTAGTVSVGISSINNQFSIRGGFWAFEQLAPTAANASVGGRVSFVKAADGMSRVRIILTNVSTGEIRTAQPNPFGWYRFEELEIGRIYIIRAESKNFSFTPASYVIELFDARKDMNFTAVENF